MKMSKIASPQATASSIDVRNPPRDYTPGYGACHKLWLSKAAGLKKTFLGGEAPAGPDQTESGSCGRREDGNAMVRLPPSRLVSTRPEK